MKPTSMSNLYNITSLFFVESLNEKKFPFLADTRSRGCCLGYEQFGPFASS